MSLKEWLSNGWLKKHDTSKEEIGNLLAIVERDLNDAGAKGLSADWKFGITYNAALKLCTMVLYVSGYQSAQGLQHYRTITALPLALGKEMNDAAGYLDACRKKRNIVEYDYAGGASAADAAELYTFTVDLKAKVIAWLKANHKKYMQD